MRTNMTIPLTSDRLTSICREARTRSADAAVLAIVADFVLGALADQRALLAAAEAELGALIDEIASRAQQRRASAT